MNIIFDGLVLGLTLTILIGPIFIALVQTGIQKGVRAGVSVGTGIWSSDFLIIGLIYLFVKQVSEITHQANFTYYMGLIGGVILMVFGAMSWFKKPKWDDTVPAFSAKSFAGYWTKGFLVNTINPFTFIFWISVMTNSVINKKYTGLQTLLLFGTIMATIMVTDTAKVVMAKLIRKRLQMHHLDWVSWVAGSIIFLFGIVLMYRSGVFSGL